MKESTKEIADRISAALKESLMPYIGVTATPVQMDRFPELTRAVFEKSVEKGKLEGSIVDGRIVSIRKTDGRPGEENQGIVLNLAITPGPNMHFEEVAMPETIGQKKDWGLCYDTIAHAAKSIGVTLHLKSIPEANTRSIEKYCVEFNMERLELSPRNPSPTSMSHIMLKSVLADEYGIKMETGYIIDQPEKDRVYLRYAKFTKIEPPGAKMTDGWNWKEEHVEPAFPAECREGHHVADLSCQTKILTVGEVTARPHVDSPLGFACRCVAQQLKELHWLVNTDPTVGAIWKRKKEEQQQKLSLAINGVIPQVHERISITNELPTCVTKETKDELDNFAKAFAGSLTLNGKPPDRVIVTVIDEPKNEHEKMVDFFTKDSREKK